LDQYRRDEPALKIDYEANDLSLLPPALEAPLFRFIQEALNNVRKHAHATCVTLRIQLFTGLLLVEVGDNGQGFDIERVMRNIPTGASRQFGLRSMRDRIQQAGGSWEIQSTYGQGTTVKARFPLTTPSASAVLTN